MEEAVPRQDAVVRAIERQRPHVGDTPSLPRHAGLANGDHLRRSIDAGERASFPDQITGDRFARPAAKIEHHGRTRQQFTEAVEPFRFHRAASRLARPGAGPGQCMSPIQPDDPLCMRRHICRVVRKEGNDPWNST